MDTGRQKGRDQIKPFISLNFLSSQKMKKLRARSFNKPSTGVPVVAQWLTHLTRNHEVVGLIPGLAQWVKDLSELWCRSQTRLGSSVAVAVALI